MAHPEADHLRERVGRIRVVVDEQRAALARAARDHPARGRERGLRLRLGPAPDPAEGLAVLVEEVGEAGALEQPPRPLHDHAKETIQVELGAEIALHGSEGLELLAARRLEGEEPRLLERDGGLVGEILQPPDLVRPEGAARRVPDREHAGDQASDRQGHREHRAVARLLDQRARLGGQGETGIGQDIGRRDRAALGHREAGEHLSSWNPGPRGKRAPFARGRNHHELMRHVIELPQRGQGPAEQAPGGLRDVTAHAPGVERLHERLAHRRERRRVAPGRSLAREDVRLIALDRAPLGQIAEYQHHAHRLSGAIPDGVRAARDRVLGTAAAHEQDAGGQRRRPVLAERARGRALGRRPGLLVDEAEDGREGAAAGLGRRPSGEPLRRRVHERDALGAVGHDDRVPDARERDRHLLLLRERVILGPAAPGGQQADGDRHEHEDEETEEVVAIGRLDEDQVPNDRDGGGREPRAQTSVPGADDHRGQEQDELRSLGQRHGQVAARERHADRQQGGAVGVARLRRAESKHVESNRGPLHLVRFPPYHTLGARPGTC